MKKILLLNALIISSFLFASKALAVCPVCTIAVGAGIGLSRWLGVDDLITGLWIGGLTVSLIIWTINWLTKKHWNFPWQWPATIVFYYAIIVAPLKWMGFITDHPIAIIWGLSKLLLGIAVGSVIFALMAWWYEVLKKKNDNHAWFPFQKIVWPVGGLLIMSLLIYFVIIRIYGY